jgi:hypothetical protein
MQWVKGMKRERRRHAQLHEIDPNFSHRYLSYVTLTTVSTLSGIFLSHSRVRSFLKTPFC